MQREDKSQSIRVLAQKMDLSHTLLLMILQGKRPLRIKHASALARGLGLSSQERLYLQALIQFDSAKDYEEKKLCQVWLSELNPGVEVTTRQLLEFELVSNWIHMAILAMSELNDFDPNPEAISKRLGARANANEIRAGIERLDRFGLIEHLPSGSFRSKDQEVTTTDDIPNEGLRRYHRDVMTLAQNAIESVPLSLRDFQAFSIAVPLEKVAIAKELIKKFRNQFVKAIGLEQGDEVFQFNIQFFQLTESPVRMVRTEDEGVDLRQSRKL